MNNHNTVAGCYLAVLCKREPTGAKFITHFIRFCFNKFELNQHITVHFDEKNYFKQTLLNMHNDIYIQTLVVIYF